jgi:hypothetical protein
MDGQLGRPLMSFPVEFRGGRQGNRPQQFVLQALVKRLGHSRAWLSSSGADVAEFLSARVHTHR